VAMTSAKRRSHKSSGSRASRELGNRNIQGSGVRSGEVEGSFAMVVNDLDLRWRESLITPVDSQWPRLRAAHLGVAASMLTVLVIGSLFFPTIDYVTLKPGPAFPPMAKSVAFYSNIPIKLGAVHVFLYGAELYFDPRNAERHIGQRLTTLWMQFFENPRWGQHFHMQIETALQVIDIFSVDAEREVPRFPPMVRSVLGAIVWLMFVTNFITSSGYHTLEEQLIGAAVALLKLFFDYYYSTEHVNSQIGSSYTEPRALLGGVALTMVAVWFARAMFAATASIEYLALIMHPTTLATLCFLGARATHMFLVQHEEVAPPSAENNAEAA